MTAPTSARRRLIMGLAAAAVAVFIGLFAVAWLWYRSIVTCDPPYHSGKVYCNSRFIGDQLQ